MKIIITRINLLIYLFITFTPLTRSSDEYFKPFKKDNITGVGTPYNNHTWNYGAAIKHSTQVTQLFENNSMIYHEATDSYKKRYNSSVPADFTASNKIKFSEILSNVNSIIRLVWLIMALGGLIFNSLSFLIIVKQGLINAGIWVYIACLSLVDNMVIIMMTIKLFSRNAPYDFIGDAFIVNNILCKFLTSAAYLCSTLSYYIMCLMTVERCVQILRPFKTPTGQKQAVIKVIILCMIISIVQTSSIWPTHGLFDLNLVDELTNSTISLSFCTMLSEYQTNAYLTALFAVEMILFAILPIIMVISANSLIVFALIRRAKNNALASTSRNKNKDKNITYMLLAISSYFLLSLMPYLIYLNTWHFFYENFTDAFSNESTASNILVCLLASNSCINYIFYSISGGTFREQAQLFFKSLKCSKDEMANEMAVFSVSRRARVQRQLRQHNAP